MQNIPDFIFYFSLPGCRRAFRGMHLNGKIFAGIQNFAEQGKAGETLVAGTDVLPTADAGAFLPIRRP
jgi:hypothetical protein